MELDKGLLVYTRQSRGFTANARPWRGLDLLISSPRVTAGSICVAQMSKLRARGPGSGVP